MLSKEFIKELSVKTALSQKNTKENLEVLTGLMREQFVKEKSITFQNFGSFKIKKTKEREVYNPTLKKKIKVSQKNNLSFKASTILKESVK